MQPCSSRWSPWTPRATSWQHPMQDLWVWHWSLSLLAKGDDGACHAHTIWGFSKLGAGWTWGARPWHRVHGTAIWPDLHWRKHSIVEAHSPGVWGVWTSSQSAFPPWWNFSRRVDSTIARSCRSYLAWSCRCLLDPGRSSSELATWGSTGTKLRALRGLWQQPVPAPVQLEGRNFGGAALFPGTSGGACGSATSCDKGALAQGWLGDAIGPPTWALWIDPAGEWIPHWVWHSWYLLLAWDVHWDRPQANE